MQINITARDFGGTEFLAQPHRLHLGAQKAEGVDRLEFSLPEQWNGCVVTLHIRHTDGTLAEPLALDETGCVSVGRSFTGWASGEWMLAAANGNCYCWLLVKADGGKRKVYITCSCSFYTTGSSGRQVGERVEELPAS